MATSAIAGGGGGSRALTPSIVEYTPPEYDEAQVQAYQQEAFAPALGALRRSMREAQAARYSSPSARREALRGATRGYGEALAPLQVGAGAQARQRYDIQYRQAIKAEEFRLAEEMRAREMEERVVERKETDRTIIGYNAAGFPIYGTSEEATARQPVSEWVGHSTTGYRTGEGGANEVVGLTEASRRPISPASGYISPLQAQPASVAPGVAYPENWMT